MKIKDAWTNLTYLPPYDGQGWAIFNNGKISKLDFEDVKASVRRWLPPNPLLIGAPGATRFLPPISIQEFRDDVAGNVANNSKKLTWAFVASGMLIAAVGFFSQAGNIFSISSVFVLFGILFFLDYKLWQKKEVDIFERAIFFHWLKTSKQSRMGFFLWLSITLIIGATQLILQKELGGIDALFDKYGAMYPAIRAGEFWRLLTGPYFHYSVTHYMLNALLLLVIGTLSYAMNGPFCFLVFIIGNSGGALMQMLLGGNAYNNFGGVSPGIYALFGFFLLSWILGSIKLPKGFAMLYGGLALLGIIGTWLTSSNAATVAHLSGLILGSLLCLCYTFVRSVFIVRTHD